MLTFYIFLLNFFLEATTVLNQEVSFFIYSLIPAFYYLEKEFIKEKIFIPFSIFLNYLFFIIFSSISFWFSVDKINTINHLFFYLSAFFLLILGFNEKEKILKNLKKILIFLGLIFSLISILPKNWFEPTALQLIFPLYPNHNHLGDFLGMVMVWLFYDFIQKKEKKYLVFLLLFLPFFILSFSRSAYIDFLIIAGMIFSSKVRVIQKVKKIIFGIFFAIFLSFLFTQKEVANLPYLNSLLSPVYNFVNFQPRSFLSNRPEYFHQAINAFLEKPLFGWGLGNFIYPSNKYVSENLQQISSALNFPLTILTETGIFGFFFFLSFFIYIVKNIDFNQKPIYFLFFYLTLNFLTDYTYSIYGVFLLWFTLAGLSIKRDKQKNFFLYPWFSLVLMIFIFLKINGLIFNTIGYSQISFYFFPFNHQAFQKIINYYKKTNKINKARTLADEYYHFSSLSLSSLNYLSNFWIEIGDKKKALFFAQKITDNNLFPPLDVVIRVYQLKKEVDGKNEAENYFFLFFERFKNQVFWMNKAFEDEVYQFCQKEEIIYCRYRYYQAPITKGKEESSKNNPYQAIYTLNNEGFNDRFDYSVKKPKDVFRILVIGDSHAFGFLVDTKNNWVEKLEDKINFQISNKNLQKKYKKVEIINLAYHSFDLAYQVERFRRQGLKYQPDLVIWMNNDFYRINEIFIPLTEKYYWLEKDEKKKEELKKQGKYFPSWQLTLEDYKKKVEKEKINVNNYQKQRIEEFFNLYEGPLIFVSLYDIPNEAKNELLRHKKVFILNLKDFTNNNINFFEKIQSINILGHQELAEIVFRYLEENNLIN